MGRGGKMTNFQAFALGIMIAWTPSLIVAAIMLLRAPYMDDGSENVPGLAP